MKGGKEKQERILGYNNIWGVSRGIEESNKEIGSKAGEVGESGIIEAKGWECFKKPELEVSNSEQRSNNRVWKMSVGFANEKDGIKGWLRDQRAYYLEGRD